MFLTILFEYSSWYFLQGEQNYTSEYVSIKELYLR